MRNPSRFVTVLVAVCLGLQIPARLHAQVPVIDAFNLIETAQIAFNTYETYRSLVQQYELLIKMARRAPGLARYRTPNVPFVSHQIGRYVVGGPLLQAFNSGDPTGNAYERVIRFAVRPESILPLLGADARRNTESAYATIDLADSTATLASHQIGHIRSYSASAASAIDALERDSLGGPDDEHYQTAILDRINAAELVARRQDAATNQLISHLLEQSLVRAKRLRDAEAIAMNMRLRQLQHYRTYSASFFPADAGAAASAWRQP
jgi:hypothetical protein